MSYKHTQTGMAFLLIFAAIIGLLVVEAYLMPSDKPLLPLIIIIAVIALTAVLFSSLTVQVRDNHLMWFFGPRFWKKSVHIADIAKAEQTRTKWYYGLGIRLTPKGWLYNISGLTAIELTLNNNKTILLGTDDADNLLAAISACSQTEQLD